MSNTSTDFLGLAEDAPAHLRPPTIDEQFDAALLADLKGVLTRDWGNHPRSQQVAIGPSEVGHPCPRRLVTKLLGLPRISPDGDPLPAWEGTAGHAKYERSVRVDNERIIGNWTRNPQAHQCTILQGVAIGRWLPEHRVTVREDLAGTADLYDTFTDTVIDLKFPGGSTLREYLKQGPPPEYRTQAHVYGRGYRREGLDVKRVAIWFIPRGGQLRKSFVWSEPYNDQIVVDTLARLDDGLMALNDLELEAHPERLALIPRVAHKCMFCPYFTPQAGHPEPQACQGAAA
ncbi:Cas4 family exonuclease [Mycobacterium phage MalagasyRose]|uniref:Cas4 family exonuclease n=1 Tax=Mycobacterium phage MalagasyRose TaxID=2599870 RepID=A0A5J6TGM5_9CAUD|nr:Cas4 family exonuclease [Mycobacterium phage MalagasyRose]QFG08909.1 Cas4 family exonuclease [Mycobacterium phage MalagasyRose]